MNNEIRQHIPPFVEGVEPEAAAFDTLDELLALTFVKNWSQHPGFFRYSMSAVGDGRYHLMAEFRGGREWWVIGLLNGAVEGLPEWDNGWYEIWTEDGKPDMVSGTEVSSSCGDEIRLRDGRLVKRRREPSGPA